MKVLVTGANGFIGSATVRRLHADGYLVTSVTRRSCDPDVGEAIAIGPIEEFSDWGTLLSDCDSVVHCAGIAHRQGLSQRSELIDLWRVNVLSTAELAVQAKNLGVRRFVFLSSVKVHGDYSEAGHPFTTTSPLAPRDPYAAAKVAAERELFRVFEDSDTDLVILRPVLVYGPGVRANFRSLIQLVNSGVPLPIKNITAKRSYISIENLVDLISCALGHSGRIDAAFLASDGEDLSLSEMAELIARGLDRHLRTFSLAPKLLRFGSGVLRKRDAVDKLNMTSQVDIRVTQSILGWIPPSSVVDSVTATAKAYREETP